MCLPIRPHWHYLANTTERVLPSAQPSPHTKRQIDHFSHFWETVCKTVRPMLSVRCLSVCDVGVLWPNGWMNQDETWHGGMPWPWPQCVRWGPSSPSPKGHSPPPNFWPMSAVAKRLVGSRCHLVRR